MIRDKNDRFKKDMLEQLLGGIEIELNGSFWNKKRIIQTTHHLSDRLGKEWGPIYEDMLGGDEDHFINVIEKEFGDYIIIYK